VARKTVHLVLLMLLASLQAAQGAVYGAILCREESGKIAVEWSGTQCESGEEKAVPCVYNINQVGNGQNENCWDVQLSSEPPLKSLAYSSADFATIHSSHFETIPPEPAGAHAAPIAALHHPAFEHLRSIRLLI
jgi:hypothetical protein